jgi:hypothetical protein
MGFGTTQFGRSVDATYPRTACGFGAPVFGGSPYGSGSGRVGATVTESLRTHVTGDMTADSWSVAVEPETPRSTPMSRVSPRISDTARSVDPPDTPDPDPAPEPVPDSISVFGDTAFGRSHYGDDRVVVVETMSLQI